jgi:hypothetical protein
MTIVECVEMVVALTAGFKLITVGTRQ